MVAAFHLIFLSFLPCTFMRHVPIARASWRVILVAGMHAWAAFIISEEELLLGSHSVRSSLIRLSLETLDNYLVLLGQFSVPEQKPKAQHVILGLYPYNNPLKFRFIPLIWGEKVGFWFPRDEVKWPLDLHVWEYSLTRLIIAAIVSKFARRHWLLQAAPCSPNLMVRCISNDGPFSSKFERDNSHPLSPFIKGAWRASFSSFCKSFQTFKNSQLLQNSLQYRSFAFRKFYFFLRLFSPRLSFLLKDFLAPLAFA